MCFRILHNSYKACRLIIFGFFIPAILLGETKTWTGNGGDSYWSNPLNWSGATIPGSFDDVLLDNRDMPFSFLVTLPDWAVTVRTLHINPYPGRHIELILPPSNLVPDAFSVTGPGYGIELDAGAIFRNASGMSSGESLFIADSMIIHDGGRYIHQTRTSHANGILRLLSTAPGTEQGIFDFDVPRASYTISVSNRTYGSLELHAGAYGAPVNYTCTGSNPLHIRGNLRIGANVSMSMDLGGASGNVQVEGDFIQEGGLLNLSSGAGDNTILRVRGDLYQSPPATITETADGKPFLELNGIRMQEIAMAGGIQNQVGFRLNNLSGCTLRLPLKLPWKMELNQGAVFSSETALLILDTGCTILADSSRQTGSYVNGPLRKMTIGREDHFLFPVGKEGNLRWLELKDASGNYTVEYIRQNPVSLGAVLGAGLDHISKLEYWTVLADGPVSDQAKIELSFASGQSGGVTDPNYLHVAKFQSAIWEDAGHSTYTGNFLQGSVVSGNTDFNAMAFTLASTLDLENPLPLTTLELQVKEESGKTVFSWTLESPERPDYFDLYEETAGLSKYITRIAAINQQTRYRWACNLFMQAGYHYFRIRMVDVRGREYEGKMVLFKKEEANQQTRRLAQVIRAGANQILIRSDIAGEWQYEIISLNGRFLKNGILKIREGINLFTPEPEILSAGIYLFRAMDSSGQQESLIFVKD
ncbi:MAG TPA: hypothetical protein DIC22_01205 [Chitinophagaceae bacterium]|jgi:hypothetical protein|nr:hypothetical protein [Chitinophagaceae bacterium]